MRRFLSLLALPLAAGLALAQAKPADPPKADKPKEKPRIAVSEPAKLKDDADFAVQGEYTGGEAKDKTGVQVIAKGNGEFDVKVLAGGLPGDGWDGKTVTMLKATRKDSAAEVTDKDAVVATIADGTLTHTDKTHPTLKKVERKSPTLGAKPPEGAVVLFAAEGDEKNWAGGKLADTGDGKFLSGGTKTKQEFKAYTLHVEFRLPFMPNSSGQGRGNSGVYLQDRYELQVLDSFGLKGENNECGGFYTLHKPKVNMCLPPMAWQTYDIEFAPAEFDGAKTTKPARGTVKHNGVVVQEDVELPRRTDGGKESGNPANIQFQNHGDPVVFRNVWLVEKK